MMTERKAGMIATQIHRARAEGLITLRQALDKLSKIQSYLSTSQYYKHVDLIDFARANPHLLDE